MAANITFVFEAYILYITHSFRSLSFICNSTSLFHITKCYNQELGIILYINFAQIQLYII